MQAVRKINAAFLSIILIAGIILPLFPKSAFAEEHNSTNYSAVLYNNANGLPTSEANDIVQTEDGFIYIGSYSGLIRYDGVNFTRFDSNTGITSVASLFCDSKNRLWVGTNDSGLALYENGGFTFYNRENGLPSLSVRDISEDAEGNIVVGTTGGMAYVSENGELSVIDDEAVSGEYIRQLSESKNGTIFGCTMDGVFFRLENLKVTGSYSCDDLDCGLVTCITPDDFDENVVWLGTEKTAVIRATLSGSMMNCRIFGVSPAASINAIRPIDDENFWICADNGIGRLSRAGKYTAENYALNNSVEMAMTDYENNVWFISSRQGVMKLAPNNFSDISALAGLPEKVVNTTCLYGEDLYIGTDSGLHIIDKNYNEKQTALTEQLDGVRIRCIFADSKNRLWLCTYGESGLLCFDGNEITSFNTENGLKSAKTRAVTELSDGTIAVATSGGAALIKDGEIKKYFDEENGIENPEILTICGGEDGKIYLGTDGGGIFVVNESAVLDRIGLEDGLKSEVILRIKPDKNFGGFWIITGNSLAYMKDGEIKTLTNFPYSNNFDIFEDDKGEAWILSSSGIYVVNAKKLISGEEIAYSFYDLKCGVPTLATANSRSGLSKDGTLYIAGQTGVGSVNINERRSNDEKIKLAVPYVDIDDKRVMIKSGETLKVPANCKRLTIYAYALTFGLSNPRLSYSLEGFDSEVFSVTQQNLRPISYTNLDSGAYTFNFSAIDPATGEPATNISIKMEKEKAFFEQFWFWGLIVFGIAGVTLLVLLIKTDTKNKRLLQKHKENRIFVDQIIRAFAKCIDLKDTYTNGHSFRVARYSSMIAEKMGYGKQEVEDIYNIGLLHDIGKIAVPDKILGKPSQLSPEEFEIISHHAENGYEILKEIEIRPDLAIGAGYHHEHFDGTGYPFGKKGDEIPEVAQIIAVADTFDAMNSTRPYRNQMTSEKIISELKRISGTQLNPKIVDVLLGLINDGKLDDVLFVDNDEI